MNTIKLINRTTILLLTLLIAAARAQEPSHLQMLPDTAAAYTALATSPQIAVAREQQQYLIVQADQYRNSKYEWILSATAQQRRVDPTDRFQEQEFGLSRSWRWYGKAGIDRSRSNVTEEIADYFFEDAWHEAGRTLLSSWFNWLHSATEVQVLEQQLPLFQAQLDATQKRIQAGDAPRIEKQLAQIEVDRAIANLALARQNMALQESQLQRDFPALRSVMPKTIDLPIDLTESDATWIQRIVENNHEIALAEAEASLAKLTADHAQRDRIADPTIGLHVGRERGGEENVYGLTLSMPLPGAARQNTYKQALADAARMKNIATQIRMKVEHDARSDILDVHSLTNQWQLLSDIDRQTQQSAAAIARGYQLGEFSFTATQTAQRQALDSKLALKKAQLDALQAQSRLLIDAHQLWTPEHDHQHLEAK
ncbi:MAG: TolC family protein [Steroidobacteraceae bacterium]